VCLEIHQDGPEAKPTAKGSGKGNDVAIVPSPKNRARGFLHTRLKPFVSPVRPDAVSSRINPGYELVDDRWDGAAHSFQLDQIHLWTAKECDDYAIP
jgi:hypothetical protein